MKTARVIITDRPKSRIGTPQHTGPYSRLRVDLRLKLEQGGAMMELVWGRGYSMRTAADILGLSRMTAWRRFNFALDWLNAGKPTDTIPHQRSTRAVPAGRPILLPRDAHNVFRQMLDSGVDAETIASSTSTVPRCIRDLAISHMALELLTEEQISYLADEADRRALRREARSASREASNSTTLPEQTHLEPMPRLAQ